VPHIVVITDGNETTGNVQERIRSGNAVVSVVPLPNSSEPEIQLAEIKLPNETLRSGEPFVLEAVVQSNIETAAAVTLYRDAFKITEIKKQLQIGSNTVKFQQTATDKPQQEYIVEVLAVPDTIAENNRLRAVVNTEGKPRILIVDSEASQMRDFASALQQQDITADIRPPEGVPQSLDELTQYDAVVLSSVPAAALSLQQMNLLRQYVSELGGGLMMLGSGESFGPGGYYKTPIEEILPVRCDIPKDKEKPSIALCLVIDRSGSMGGQKMELAKDAAKAAVELLTPKDFAAVIAFDNECYPVCSMQSTATVSTITAAISSIEPAGGTNIYPALAEAFSELRKTAAKLKHVILLTDGQSAPGDFEGIAGQMAAEQMTLSTVGIGEADNELLKTLADIGKGRHYVCSDPQTVPQIFVKETITASQSALHEEPFVPVIVSASKVLDGIDIEDAPPLLGYAGVQVKPATALVLATGSGDPLLVFRRYGLGTTAAFTSDAKSRWSAEWLSWQSFGKLWSQIIREVMRKTNQRGIKMHISRNAGGGRLVSLAIDAVDASEQFINGAAGEVVIVSERVQSTPSAGAKAIPSAGAKARPLTVPLTQTAPGHYYAEWQDTGTPSLLTATLQQNGQVLFRESRGIAENYPLELRVEPTNEMLLRSVVSDTGGLYNPTADELIRYKPEKAAYQSKPLRNYLLALAAFLFVFDVFLRRVELMQGGDGVTFHFKPR
jgi:uncharacterized membrane protein